MSEPTICPLLVEFAGWPGFPEAPIREERYHFCSDNRKRDFLEALGDLSLAEVTRNVGARTDARIIRYAAARIALTSAPYLPTELPSLPAIDSAPETEPKSSTGEVL